MGRESMLKMRLIPDVGCRPQASLASLLMYRQYFYALPFPWNNKESWTLFLRYTQSDKETWPLLLKSPKAADKIDVGVSNMIDEMRYFHIKRLKHT